MTGEEVQSFAERHQVNLGIATMALVSNTPSIMRNITKKYNVNSHKIIMAKQVSTYWNPNFQLGHGLGGIITALTNRATTVND